MKKQIRISSHRKSSDLLFGFRIQFALTLGSQFVFMTIQSYQDSKPPSEPDRLEGMETIHSYKELIKQNIEYDILIQRNEPGRVEEIVELMVDTVCSGRKIITVAGDDYPHEVVRSRFLKIDSSHVEYVFDCIDQNTTKVRNIKKYLLAALYNAPATIDNYYRAEVNHHLYGTDN